LLPERLASLKRELIFKAISFRISSLFRDIFMPKHTQNALITWIPNSSDGMREAKKLNKLFDKYSVIKDPGKLSKADLGNYMSVIIIGHRGEFTANHNYYLESLAALATGSGCGWIVLANCSSAVAAKSRTLEVNELWAPGQKLANRLKIKVSATKRDLGFDEVGKGLAFALTLGEVLTRSNPPGSELWHDFGPQTALEEITEGLSNI